MTPRSRMRADDVLYRQRQTRRGGQLFYESTSQPIEPRGSRAGDVIVIVFAILGIVLILTGVLQ